jgi:hypothetical protein
MTKTLRLYDKHGNHLQECRVLRFAGMILMATDHSRLSFHNVSFDVASFPNRQKVGM